MKRLPKFLFFAALALLAAAAARAQSLSLTAISAALGTALPGDQITFAITVSNSAAAANFESASSDKKISSRLTNPEARK